MSSFKPSNEILALLKKGVVIPASPLALDENRKIDERFQRGLYRYYTSAGAGGIAVGVHTTQFEIRNPEINFFKPLLKLASEEIDSLKIKNNGTIIKIAGVCGNTKQAIQEAEYAVSCGYDLALLSLGALKNEDENSLIKHCIEISKIIGLIGFYLQPAVGGRILPYSFWRKFAEIENVHAIKIAPFNRYQSIDVVRAVAESGREKDITLYTGNDDNIIIDLLTPFNINTKSGVKTIRIMGGLLGQWAVWTKTAVSLLNEIHEFINSSKPIPIEILSKNAALTDANAVIFDVRNNFAGCIPGINEILRRQGLLRFNYCLNPNEVLSLGQSEEIDRISKDYPWLTDDDFIRENINSWID